MKILLAVLVMSVSLSASAQKKKRSSGEELPGAAGQQEPLRPGGERGHAAEAAPPATRGDGAPPSAPDTPPAAPSGALAFLRWATGDREQPGAYEAPALCCRLARDISNANVGPRVASYRGLQFSVPFIRDVLSNARLCRPGPATAPGGGHAKPALAACSPDEPLGLPAAEVLPVPPQAVLDWLKPSKAAPALYRYMGAPDGEGDAHATLGGARDEFFEVAWSAALQNTAALKAFCAEIEPANPGCPGELATGTPAQARAKARAARTK